MKEIKKEIVYDFIEEYMDSFDLGLEGDLKELEERCTQEKVPIIKKDVIHLLRVLLSLKKPKRILEIGTAFGFSSILMANEVKEAMITTLERDDWMCLNAKKNIKQFELEDRIGIILGEAIDTLKGLEEKFDFIFIDASKSHYAIFMKESKRLLAEGGMIVADNVLYKGMVAKDRYDVHRRFRTIHRNMRDLIKGAYEDKDYKTCLVPAGDGILITTKQA